VVVDLKMKAFEPEFTGKMDEIQRRDKQEGLERGEDLERRPRILSIRGLNRLMA
jgi:hypothetical protein